MNIYLASLFSNKSQHWKRGLASEVYEDGTFELVPIPAGCTKAHPEDKTYDDIPSHRNPRKSLAEVLGFDRGRSKQHAHDDPDLHTGFGYGDVRGPKSAALFDATPGDWLLIIANLAFASKSGRPDLSNHRTGWHFVGCLKISAVDFAGNGRFHSSTFAWHQHARDAKKFRYDMADGDFSIVVAGKKKATAQRFAYAVPVLSATNASELLRDKCGNPVNAERFPTVMSCIGSYTRGI
ncbi:hypothetical protein PLCT2_02500 [Planctomycetaceae bacterium]|nr:hypothetical protein PLCT2_02500 [Planctomycetaceae bacterium]